MKKKQVYFCLLLFFCICLTHNTTVQAKIKLNKTSLSLNKGKTYTLKLSNKKKATWSSSKKSVATVSSSGKVKAKKKGTAYIYAKYKKKKYKCKVTVKQPVTKITLNKTSVNVKKSKTYQLSAKITPSNANNKKVTWSSSNKKVATVSSSGKVKAIKCGTTTITCKAKDGSNKKKTTKITVTQNVTGIKLNKTSATVTAKSTICLTPSVTPTDATNKSVNWTSSNTKIAKVSNTGVVTGIQAGSATITCTAKDGSKKSARCFVTVTKSKINSTFTINPDSDVYDGKYQSKSSYTDLTKHYYLLRSYMEALEERGGGSILLESGTYVITNVIYVPSNTKIIFDEGVIIRKETKTDKNLSEAASIFQLVDPSFPKDGSMVEYGYDGAHDITFEGLGNVTFDMQHKAKSNGTGSMGIVMGHCQNINIYNINFINMAPSGHFIELNSSQNVTVENCTFTGNVTSGTKEAINIDSTDEITQGFNHPWSSHDLTCVDNVLIDNCDFSKLRSAVGTHKYSVSDEGIQQYHKNVTIQNCKFDTVGSVSSTASAIRMKNWLDAIVQDNTFTNCLYYSIRCYGVDYPIIENNIFTYQNTSQRAILFKQGTNSGTGSEYPMTYNQNIFPENFIYNKTNASVKVFVYNEDNTSHQTYKIKN